MTNSELQAALNKLQCLGEELLVYYQINLSSWNPEDYPSDQEAVLVAEQICQLCKVILACNALEGQPSARSASENQERFQQIQRYFVEINAMYEDISSIFLEWNKNADVDDHEGDLPRTNLSPLQFRLHTPWIPLTTPSESAYNIINGDAEWDSLLWSLIADDDLGGAYWFVRSMQASGKPSSLPDWLLSSMLGSRWLAPSTDTRLLDDLTTIASEHKPQTDLEMMFGLSTALLPTLLSAQRTWFDWLHVPHEIPGLTELAQIIHEAAAIPVVATPQAIVQVANIHEREALISAKVAETQEWLERAPKRHIHNLQRVVNIWRFAVAPGGVLYQVIHPVTLDARDQLDEVRDALKGFQQATDVWTHMEMLDREVNPSKQSHQIEGGARNILISNVQKGCELAQIWCDLVQGSGTTNKHSVHMIDQISRLRADIQSILPTVYQSLEELETTTYSAPWRAASRSLQRSIAWMCQTLLIPEEDDVPSRDIRKWFWLWKDAGDLDSALNQRLLLMPAIGLDDARVPTEDHISLIKDELRDAYAKNSADSLIGAIHYWCDKRDYRFVEDILDVLTNQDPVQGAGMQEFYQESRSIAAEELAHQIDKAEFQTEQAVLDGIIGDNARSDYLTAILAINPSEVRQFSAVETQIADLLARVNLARARRIEHLENIWHEKQRELDLTNPQHRKLHDRIERALHDEPDPRLVDQLLAHVRNSYEPIPSDSDTQIPILTDFMNKYSLIESLLNNNRNSLASLFNDLSGAIKSARPCHGLDYRVLDSPRQKEAQGAITAWSFLRNRSIQEIEKDLSHFRKILTFLGFTVPLAQSSIRLNHRSATWLHLRADIRASKDLVKPIYQLGSEADATYDILCVRNRPSVQQLGALVSDCKMQSKIVLIFYIGWFDQSERQEWRRVAGKLGLTALVLDEALLIYLTLVKDRLEYFTRCTVPFTAIKPYTPTKVGSVPEEMFYGEMRRNDAKRIQDEASTFIIYGGRQLGKSALMRHAARQYHNPARGQYACFIDIKMIGDTRNGKGTSSIWRKIRQELQRIGFLSDRLDSDRMEKVVENIQKALNSMAPGEEASERRLILLLDEADDFLDADAQNKFRNVEALRQLMSNSGLRFKVIFAGLHNVQRFKESPNQPLAHFGTEVCIGPLALDDARQLIVEPLQALGYYVDDAAVLRIMSYTNLHAGLIQYFCDELVQALHSDRRIKVPYSITQRDVVSIYRREPIREKIRERFDWTLALDSRYQAVAWSLVVDQLEAHDSFAKPYSSDQVLHLMRYWWPEGFAETKTGEDMKIILNEMVGLGVLVRNLDNTYYLRNPNLVRLMGTENDIAEKLLNLVSRPANQGSAVDDYHSPLELEAQTYSPLSNREDRILSRHGYGIGLGFASAAQGGSQLPNAFARYAQDDQGQPKKPIILPSQHMILDTQQFREWLDSLPRPNTQDENGFVAVIPLLTLDAGEMMGWINEAQSFVEQRRQSHDNSRFRGRIIFILDAAATREWLRLPHESRQSIENSVDAVIYPKHWSEAGIAQRLEQTGRIATDTVCAKVLRVTGGWHYLLDELFDRSYGMADPTPALERLENELADPESSLSREFLRTTGIDEQAERVLRCIHDAQGVPADEDWSEMVGEGPTMTPEEYRQTLTFLQRMGCLFERVTKRPSNRSYFTEVMVNPVLDSLLSKRWNNLA